jgi:hypothetical protein
MLLRVEDELAATIDAGLPGDPIGAADDRYLVDETVHEDVAKSMGRQALEVCLIIPNRWTAEASLVGPVGSSLRLCQYIRDDVSYSLPIARLKSLDPHRLGS